MMAYNTTNTPGNSPTLEAPRTNNVRLEVKKIPHNEFWGKPRILRSLLISLLQKFKLDKIEIESTEKQIPKKKRRKKTPHNPSRNKNQKPKAKKPNTTEDMVPKVLSLLAEGKTEEALNAYRPNNQNTKTSRSRFLNGLNCATKNRRKALWISSFCDDTNPKAHTNQETRFQFTPFQYWSQGQLPYDLQDIQEKWNKIFLNMGLPAIKLFNKSSAREWIALNAPEFIKSFEKAPLFAVEADIFRIAYALKNDCIWIDSDQYPKKNTEQLIQEQVNTCDTLLVFRWNRPWVTNSFFLTRKASPLFENIFNASLNYEFPTKATMTRNDVLRSFGPGRYNTSLNKIFSEESIQPYANSNHLAKAQWISKEGWRYAFLNEKNLCALKPPFKLNYENSEDSWHNKV